MQFKYHSYSATHVGKKRTNNEDAYGELEISEGKIFIVCDGMGGHAAGERASEIAVQTMKDYFKSVEVKDVALILKEAIQHANRNIWDEALNDPSLKGMGTTCVVVFIQNNGAIYIGHVGDSRCYLYTSDKKLSSLTRDHSYVQFLIESGDVKPEEAFDHPSKNRILKALGIEENVTPEVTENPIHLSSGDTLLLCTDGLNDMLRDNEIQNTLEAHPTPEKQVEVLLNEALEKGGKDNITLTVIKIDESPFQPKQHKKPEAGKTHPEKSKKNKKLFYFLTLLVLLAIGGFFYFFLPFNDNSNTKAVPVQNNPQDSIPKSDSVKGGKINKRLIPTH